MPAPSLRPPASMKRRFGSADRGIRLESEIGNEGDIEKRSGWGGGETNSNILAACEIRVGRPSLTEEVN